VEEIAAQGASIEMALLPFMFDSAKSSLGTVASACRSSDATNFVRAALISCFGTLSERKTGPQARH
jgi:hypothetical protein